MSSSLTIAQLLDWAYLQLVNGESPKLDARLLLSHSMGKTTTHLLTWPEKKPSQQQVDKFKQLILKRQTGYPIAYLLGFRDFWTLQLDVSEHTLIPRPETELLVESALQLDLPEHAKVLDLGTGTGAIALSLAKEKPLWSITAVDSILEAVALAKHNAKQNGIASVDVYQSDWFSNVIARDFDLIISNPPYVEAASDYLVQGDVRYEPLSALTAGDDGMDDISQIIAAAPTYLAKGGWLMIEHGFNQAQAIAQLFKRCQFYQISHKKDLNNIDRMSQARWK